MQKVLSVNLIFLFFIPIIVAQEKKIEGEFCNVQCITDCAECFRFNKNGTFLYTSGGDIGGDEVGSGKYYVKDNLLILKYEKRDLYNLSYHKASKSMTKNDSVSYHFNVRNFNGEPISNAQIIYENLSSSKTDGVILNENANGSLNFKKAYNDTIKIRISYIGYNIYTLYLRKDYNYYINVFLANAGQELPIGEQTETFHIIKLKNNVLKLKNRKGRVTEWLKINK